MLAVLTICMMLSAGCHTADKNDTSSEVTKLEEIQERGVLKVGTTGDYQPISYLDPGTGEYVGFDIELAEDLADVTLIIHDVNQEIPGLIASGEADVMVTEIVEAGYYVGKDDRLAAPLIYEPFTHGELGVLMPKGSEDLLDYVNGFLKKEKKSGRIDELADEYFLKYIEYEEELAPAA